MRILYIASAIEAGGTSGGWTHVTEVACGLAALGHDVRVIARGAPSGTPTPCLGCGVMLKSVRLPQYAAVAALPLLMREFSRFRPDVVIERYYNFAGAGVLAAHRRGVPVLLELNAPMVDPPRSLKARVDTLLLGSLRSWAVRQARWSAAIVTPLASTIPPEIARHKIHELPWGANVERFDPARRVREQARLADLAASLGLEPNVPVAVFLGSFRAWHGAAGFVQAARRLLATGANVAFLTIGSGPELAELRAQVSVSGVPHGRFVFAGARPHDTIPDFLALADIGVAPFDLSAHPPLTKFGFYWSPLKIFEYMAMALPVITVNVPPLNEIVRDGKEGLLYESGNIAGLTTALETLASQAPLRRTLGESARLRVIERYSWQAHCRALDKILHEISNAS